MAAPNSLSVLGQAALAYACKGWPVFPCKQRGKEPLVRDWPNAATTNPERIRTWWNEHPTANIGHPTGKHVVLDIDGEEGEAALELLEKQHGPLPNTLTARTGKGRHLYFDANGTRIRNSAGKLGPHLDVRGEGGYVILSPSIHPSGKKYEWLSRMKPAPLPQWLAKLLGEPERGVPPDSSTGEKIPQGQRNTHLASLAGSMRRRGMSPAAIEAALQKENALRCDAPLLESEVRRIAASVSQYDPAKPGAQPSGETIPLAKPLRWLWPGRIPLGKLALIAGDPGLGKSLLTIDLAARVSTGAAFPDGTACEQGNVILLSAEDDAADTIRPRLDAADADVSRVHWFEAVRNVTADGRSVETVFSLERDIDVLEDAIRQSGARLVVIDPISAYLGEVDSHNNSSVRGLLSPLARFAATRKVAVIAISHLRKSAGAAIHRIVESLAFSAAARAAWGVAPDPDDRARRLFAPIKQNLAPDTGGLAYRIEAPAGVGRIVWEPGAVAVDVNAVMSGFESREADSERREASEWLRDFLADGPRGAADVRSQARLVGLTWITVRRAADSISILKRKIGGRGAGWEWAMPGNFKDAQVKDAHPTHTDVSTFEHPGENKGDNVQFKVKDAHVSNTEHLWPESTLETGPDAVEI